MNSELDHAPRVLDSLQVGCDVHSVANTTESIEIFGESYLNRVFSFRERAECVGHAVTERLTGRFAAKEAVLKAMRVPAGIAIPWPTIEVLADEVGAPVVHLSGAAADFASRAGIGRIEVSLSHDGGFALAFAVAVPTASLQERAA